MGGTCSPGQGADDEADEKKIDTEGPMEDGEDDTNEKFTNIINDYQATNEKLRNELESLKDKKDESVRENEEKTRKNEEVMRELNEMKTLVDVKNKAIVRGRLQAALLSSMLSLESTSRLCKKGELKLLDMDEIKVTKYVELRICDGEVLDDDYKSGYLVLTYSDKVTESTERYQVQDVITDYSESKEKPAKEQHIFSIRVSHQNTFQDITFSCETAKEKDDWIRALGIAKADVESTYNHMYDLFTLKLEFSKKKMGIRVEESLVQNEEDEKSEQKVQDENADVKEDGMETLKKVVENMEEGIQDTFAKEESEESQEESKTMEHPCELLVTNISDEDLIAGGLKLNCVVRAINDKPLAGMTYSEQLDLLVKTPKPYTLTFTGENFLKHEPVKPESEHGYHAILKELTADGENAVKSAFNDLVKGTLFERELEASTDKIGPIEKLLSNQRRLRALLKKFNIQDVEL